ncbi:cationic amino acid transporter 2 [Acyrthosiphon pisum]|uniref:Cationic amino acid transporter C-terminal domain-containing protein n=1 Tax=Acyrthosiphon pisum TaxID=7029 RepID=A0A8R1W1U1_ACYPI|nr:cationic amino acid transporter 2 [Acyrthosiphon pisum]|eukprot:XP_001944238.2 PREDICTED: cationic amino acid transporter 2 [Acyrthosiphon pisum]
MSVPKLPTDFRRDGLALITRMVRTKDLDDLQGESSPTGRFDPHHPTKLKKCLNTIDLTSLGVGSCLGTGMYVVTGLVARRFAGPAVILSFIIAAVASLFSGACYAEFGVRVPNTSGSAYMYSYVTVGEFIAFLIGWNMVLEYLIGTSACACALSASLDSLTNGAISASVQNYVGFLGKPDILAAGITLLMMVLLAAGVKKSLVFNHLMNAINLAAWVFLMSAGLFYVNLDNWTKNDGFLPNGWGGVFKGAATCFYAFIGFDIIATTGEEAHNPKKSIPLAIMASLVIILVAYVSSSIILTLIVPYTKIDENAALLDMFVQVGAPRCQMVVAAGAMAGLLVSMFGSMFPMPRIIYSMAQDGLLFKSLSQIFPLTGTPVVATVLSGVASAVAALVINLDTLIEMMSIGTLFAYTLVSTCVLILRYQPQTSTVIHFFPETMRSPMNAPKQIVTNGRVNFVVQDDQKYAYTNQGYGNQTSFYQTQLPLPQQIIPSHQSQRIMVRKVTRSSPDSDDTYFGDDSEEGRDDQYLVSDRCESKFYGSVHGGSTAGSTAAAGGFSAASANITRSIKAATYLCPAIFPWVDMGPATEESGMVVLKLVGVFYVLIIVFDVLLVFVSSESSTFVYILLYALLIAVIAVLGAISRKPQNKQILVFKTPWVPFVPSFSIAVNLYLIFQLSSMTLLRIVVWVSIGLFVYFYYGIKHSTLEPRVDEDERIELKMKSQTMTKPQNNQPPAPAKTSANTTSTTANTTTTTTATASTRVASSTTTAAVVDENKTEPKRPTNLEPLPASNDSNLFVSPSAFPKWED